MPPALLNAHLSRFAEQKIMMKSKSAVELRLYEGDVRTRYNAYMEKVGNLGQNLVLDSLVSWKSLQGALTTIDASIPIG